MNIPVKPLPSVVRKTGDSITSHLLNAVIQSDMGGLGGCEEFDIKKYPKPFQDLITAYLGGTITSEEAIFLAMLRTMFSSVPEAAIKAAEALEHVLSREAFRNYLSQLGYAVVPPPHFEISGEHQKIAEDYLACKISHTEVIFNEVLRAMIHEQDD